MIDGKKYVIPVIGKYNVSNAFVGNLSIKSFRSG